MALTHDAKGRFAEMIVSTLLETADYRVLRFGVEESISEVKAAQLRREKQFVLPDRSQAAPDFLVLDLESGRSTLLEVKFRRTFDSRVAQQLRDRLQVQAELWPEVVVAVVSPRGDGEKPLNDIRSVVKCFAVRDFERLVDDHPTLSRWNRLRTIGSFFEKCAEAEFYEEATRLVPAIVAWDF